MDKEKFVEIIKSIKNKTGLSNSSIGAEIGMNGTIVGNALRGDYFKLTENTYIKAEKLLEKSTVIETNTLGLSEETISRILEEKLAFLDKQYEETIALLRQRIKELEHDKEKQDELNRKLLDLIDRFMKEGG